MKSSATNDTDAFLTDLDELALGGEGLEVATRSLGELPASVAMRSCILGALSSYERFARFEPAVAELLQISCEEAAAALRRIDDPSAWQEQAPGLAYLSVPSGPERNFHLAGFLRVAAGLEFPQHEHLGEEITLVLQGAFEESSSGQLFLPGQPSRMPGGSRHTFRVPADGPNLVGLVTVEVGVRLIV